MSTSYKSMHLVLYCCIVSGRRTSTCTQCTWNYRRRWCGAFTARSFQCQAHDEPFTERHSPISVQHLTYNTCLWYLAGRGGWRVCWRGGGGGARARRRCSCSYYRRSRRPAAAAVSGRACHWPSPAYLTRRSGWYHRWSYLWSQLKKNKFCSLKKSS